MTRAGHWPPGAIDGFDLKTPRKASRLLTSHYASGAMTDVPATNRVTAAFAAGRAPGWGRTGVRRRIARGSRSVAAEFRPELSDIRAPTSDRNREVPPEVRDESAIAERRYLAKGPMGRLDRVAEDGSTREWKGAKSLLLAS